MKGVCPIKTNPDWISLENAIGENNAWKVWIAGKTESLPEPVAAAFYLYVGENPEAAASLLENNIPAFAKLKMDSNTTVLDMIDTAYDKIFEDESFKAWLAEKDFFDKIFAGETITRTPEQQEVVTKKDQTLEELAAESPDLSDSYNLISAIDLQNKMRATEIITQYAQGQKIDFAVINAKSAQLLLNNTPTPYKGESVFRYKNITYYVQDRISVNTEFHNVVLPYIYFFRTGKRKRFDALYQKLIKTPMGLEIENNVATTYPKITSRNFDVFMDKVIVAALRKDALNKSLNKSNQIESDPVTVEFNNVIKDIMNEIKPLIRENFKKANVTRLITTDTLNQLADMLQDEDFNVETEDVTDEKISLYNKELEEAVAEINKFVDNKEKETNFINIIDSIIEKNDKQLQQTKAKPYWDIKKVLSDDESGGYLRSMSDTLKNLRKDGSPEKIEAFTRLPFDFKARALVRSLFTLDKTLNAINDHLIELKNSEESSEKKLEKVLYYNHLLLQWEEFIKDSKNDILNAGMPSSSFLYRYVATLDAAIEKGKDTYKEIQKNGSVKIISGMLNSFTEKIKKELNERIKELESKKGDSTLIKKEIEKLNKKLEKYNFDEEKVMAIFNGKTEDSSFWSTMFESYSTNPDPILASFALYLKENTTKITTAAFNKAKAFAEELRPLRDTLGKNTGNAKNDFGEFIGVDVKPVKDENGIITSQSVLKLLSPTKNERVKVAELDQAIEKAKRENNTEDLKKAYEAKEDHLNEYFNRQYKKEYYIAQKSLYKNNFEAWQALQDIDRDIRSFKNSLPTELDFFEGSSELDVLYQKRQRLFSEYDEIGVLKDEAGRNIAKALSENRKLTSKFYKAVEKKGAFQRSFDSFADLMASNPKYKQIQKLDSEGNLTDEFKKELYTWINQNSQVKYTDAYYTKLNSILDKLSAQSAGLPDQYRVDDLYKERTSLLMSYRDSNGQTDPSKMQDKREIIMAKLKEIQERINGVQDDVEADNILDPEQKIILKDIFAQLKELRFTEPTTYYLDEINNYMTSLKLPDLTKETADTFIKDTFYIKKLMAKSPSFGKWFKENHITRTYIDKNGEEHDTFDRLSAWSIAKPREEDASNPIYTIQTKLTYNGETFIVDGVPNRKYFYTTIKDEYKTIQPDMTSAEKAKIVDNRGQYLPLSKEQKGAPATSPYYDEDYYNLIKDPNKKKMLEILTKYQLDNQQGLDRNQKLYLDIPRFPLSDNLESLQRGQFGKKWFNRLKGVAKGIKASLSGKSKEEINEASKQEGDFEEGFANADLEKEHEQLTMTKEVLLNPIMDKVPMRGISNIPIEQVSYDLLTTMNMYMLQAEKQRVFNEISPVAQAMLNTLENTDKGTKKLEDIRGKNGEMRDSLKAITGNKDKSVRAAGFRALYNREFKGQVFSEKHLDWINKVTNALTTGASINYFALNLPSAVKNYWGILWQLNVEAAAGEYFSFNSMRQGKLRSKKAMNEWTIRIWGGKYNTLDTQLIMYMDPIQGKADEVIGKDFNRNLKKDIASLSFVYSPRKFMEMEGGLQLFYSMMYHKKLPRVVEGRDTEISYAEAFELDKDGRLTLKSGIDASYGITYDEKGNPIIGEKFQKFQNAVHEKFKDLNGAFAKFEQPQAQAYFAFRLFAFMRRYFTSMFMNRFGKERANFALESVRTGYYLESIQAVSKMLVSFGKYIPLASKSEKRALIKMSLDIAQIMILSAIASLLFGYDDDDEDRFEKLRAKSGALNEDDFRLDGWLSNQTLTLLLKTQAENQSFIPLPGLGLNNYMDLTSSTSLAFGPTITAYAKILTDLSMHAMPGEDDDLFYKKDTGPYSWQKEGSAKIWNHLGSMIGFSGSQVDPVKGLKSFDSFGRR